MTIFAVICAGIFPGIHVGRVWVVYWLFPIPNQHAMWPNFRSPLLWDVFAVGTYATVSLLFWYMGMVPDLATLRDRATSQDPADRLRRAVAWAGAAATGTGTATRRPTCCWPAWPRRWCSRCTRSCRFDFAVVAAARLAHDDLPALLRRRRHLLRLRHGGHAAGPGARSGSG